MNIILKALLLLELLILGFSASAQEILPKEKPSNKGKMYFYWGWNRARYTDSDIHFKGEDYDFTLLNASAHDRQTPIGADPYLHVDGITIPQTNVRLGYFFNDHYEISIGVDHMKYVMDNGDMVNVDGYISGTGTAWDGVYENDPILLSYTFLSFEHTDGLNYINTALARHDLLFDWIGENGRGLNVYSVLGAGVGVLYPKTNARIMQMERNDEFHLAGYGMDLSLGLRFEVYEHFFVQGHSKGGFINMPDILTSPDDNDRASQKFFFGQLNFVFGYQIMINSKSE